MIYLQRAVTAEEVEAVLKNPEIFARIAEDGHDSSDYKVSMDNCFMLIMDNEDVIGVWCLYPVNRTTMNIHCNVLEQHREHGKEAGRLILDWFVNESPEQYQKLNAEIPIIYPEVYNFTKGFGFHDEGINRVSIMKNGQIVDQWRLGITREEAKGGGVSDL